MDPKQKNFLLFFDENKHFCTEKVDFGDKIDKIQDIFVVIRQVGPEQTRNSENLGPDPNPTRNAIGPEPDPTRKK